MKKLEISKELSISRTLTLSLMREAQIEIETQASLTKWKPPLQQK